MNRIAIAAAVLIGCSSLVWAQNDGDDEDTYVPRSERTSTSVMTFVGSNKGLEIIDHRTGEVTRYSSRRQPELRELDEESQARANERWEQRQAEQEAYDEEMEEKRAEEAENDSEDSEDSDGGEDAGEES